MLTTSLDVLYLTIAFCILLISIMIVLCFGYVLKVIKRFKDVIDMVADKIEKVGQLIDSVKNKFDSNLNQVITIVEGAKKLANFIYKKSKTRPSKNEGTKTKKTSKTKKQK